VAATRAGQALVISQRESANARNPWQRFEPQLVDAPELPDPGPVERVEQQLDSPGPAELRRASEAIARRREDRHRETYAVVAAKEHARRVFSRSSPTAANEPERHIEPPAEAAAADWGKAIHSLLELATARPETDLTQRARQVLEEQQLDEALCDLAVATVQGAMDSEIWQRAVQSPCRKVEVPFSTMAAASGTDAAGLPTLIRGCIDLVFREAGGWVVVDYKTDDLRRASAEARARHHGPQVRLYARAWEQLAREPVKEMGLLFTSVRPAVYVKL